jgi:hypothetical protein
MTNILAIDKNILNFIVIFENDLSHLQFSFRKKRNMILGFVDI